MDLTSSSDVRRIVREVRPDVVLNAAAYTAVDKAESEPELAHLVNAVAPGVLAEEVERIGGLLVHYSTDYVFDGSKREPYTEEDTPNPVSVYGASKLQGELAIQQSGVAHMIFRTSWVYGVRGRNFLLTMLRLLHERPELKVVNDQIGAPTSAQWIARATLVALVAWRTSLERKNTDAAWGGVFHMTAGGVTSWFGFASAIRARCIARSDAPLAILLPVAAADYSTLARRPLNSVLSNRHLASQFEIEQPGWEELLDQCMVALPAGTIPSRRY